MLLRRTCAVIVFASAVAPLAGGCSNTAEGLFPERDAEVIDAPPLVDAREEIDATLDAGPADAGAIDDAKGADAGIADAGADDAAARDAVR